MTNSSDVLTFLSSLKVEQERIEAWKRHFSSVGSGAVPGVMGIRNHGNTCFINAVLQCLSYTDILAGTTHQGGRKARGTKKHYPHFLPSDSRASWTLEGLLRVEPLSETPFMGPCQPHAFLPELQRNKDTICCAPSRTITAICDCAFVNK